MQCDPQDDQVRDDEQDHLGHVGPHEGVCRDQGPDYEAHPVERLRLGPVRDRHVAFVVPLDIEDETNDAVDCLFWGA